VVDVVNFGIPLKDTKFFDCINNCRFPNKLFHHSVSYSFVNSVKLSRRP
jgi:hypothetical protein